MTRTCPLRSALACVSILVLSATAAPGQSWERFRGPDGAGVIDAASVPTRWDESQFRWRVELPGTGHSHPVGRGDRLFVTCASADGASRTVVCISAKSGATLWSDSVSMSSHGKHNLNSFASSTPAVDGERVYVIFTTPESYVVRALTHQGKEVWKRDLGAFHSNHGSGASPVVFEDFLIVPKEEDEDSAVFALDRATGETRWTASRRSASTAYGSPLIYRPERGDPQILLTSEAHGISSLDARTGKALWEAPLFDKRTVSSPVVGAGLVFGTCGSGAGGNYLVAVRMGGAGDVSTTHLAYKIEQSIPYVPTPIARGDRVWLWNERGIVTCLEAASGKVVWRDRADGAYYGSPILIGDRLYAAATDGTMVVLSAGDKFEVLARNPLGEGTHSTPAVHEGKLYVRTFKHLVAIGGGSAADAVEPAGDAAR